MRNLYHRIAASLRHARLTVLLAGGTTLAAHAQFAYTPATSSTLSGTFTDLGTSGTVITTANTDDANSAAQSIGFTFNYNGAAFTQFVLNTNGLIRLGPNAPSSAAMFGMFESGQATGVDPIASTDAADVNLLIPFNFDLEAGTGGTEYRMATTGTAPNRVCTVQWKNVSDKSAVVAKQYTTFSFQLQLYETSNSIDFIYSVPTTGSPDAARHATVGIKGSSSTDDVLVNKVSTTVWSAPVFITGAYVPANGMFNYRQAAVPTSGRTYRFIAPKANDAAVTTIYTLGKLLKPASLPHTVQAVVTNLGSTARTNLVVTLSVTNANTINTTQTIASLAAGASTTVSFAPFPTTLNLGTNNLTVSVPSDDDNTNNTATYTQVVSATQLLVGDATLGGTATLNGNTNTAGAVLASKFTTNAAGSLNSATIYFGTGSTATTSYSVVVYDATGPAGAPGTLLYTATARNRPATGGAVTVTFPTTQVPASFYVGIKELDTNGAGLATQPESPLRTGTFFYSPNGSTNWADIAASTSQVRLLIEAGLVSTLATSKELGRALSIYPNPTTSGLFYLDAKGASVNATSLGVEVSNALGQRVYVGSAHDNTVNAFDLSNLAPGLYHLTVRNGSDFISTKLIIRQ